jgi:APA family basic amino acid/polyamine antiporter
LQKLGFIGTISLVIGNIIGVGIFTTTGFMTNYLDSPLYIILAWFLGAIYALSGAKVYGILAAEYPLSGGDYQYLAKALHPLAGYLFGWAAFFVTYSGSIAALGIAAAYYLNGIFNFSGFETVHTLISIGSFELTISQSKILAIIFIIVFSWISYRGILLSGTFQIVLTTAIFLLLILFSVSGTISPAADYSLLHVGSESGFNLSGFLTSLIAVLFSYIGWTTAVYVAEEIKDAKSVLPSALRLGVILVGVIYLWINMVYLIALPINEMKDVINIATPVFDKLWGMGGGIVISSIILIAVFSSLNSTILSGPRIYMAMGRDGYFLGLTKELHKKHKSPHRAIVFQALWSIILVLSGSFNQLLSFVIFVIVAFSLMASLISFRINMRKKDYSVISLFGISFYGLFCLTIMGNTLIEKPYESIIGLFLITLALPFYYFDKKGTKKYKLM